MSNSCDPFTIPFQGSASDLLAKVSALLHEHGGSITGGIPKGSFSVNTAIGLIAGNFFISGQNITVTITQKPYFFPTCSQIESFVRDHIPSVNSIGIETLLPPIKVKIGDLFEISVPSNPSTGFACVLSLFPNSIYLVSSTYYPHAPIRPGSGGSQVFKFVAIAKGQGPVEFRDVKFSHPLEIAPQQPMQKRFVIVE